MFIYVTDVIKSSSSFKKDLASIEKGILPHRKRLTYVVYRDAQSLHGARCQDRNSNQMFIYWVVAPLSPPVNISSRPQVPFQKVFANER